MLANESHLFISFREPYILPLHIIKKNIEEMPVFFHSSLNTYRIGKPSFFYICMKTGQDEWRPLIRVLIRLNLIKLAFESTHNAHQYETILNLLKCIFWTWNIDHRKEFLSIADKSCNINSPSYRCNLRRICAKNKILNEKENSFVFLFQFVFNLFSLILLTFYFTELISLNLKLTPYFSY